MPIDKKQLAAEYGWSYSFLKSQPELWKLFNRAVKKNYTPERFVAELRSTRWFRKHSESVRKAQLLKKTDPATYNSQLNQLQARIVDMATQMGADASGRIWKRIATNALQFGWNDNQIRNVLAHYVDQFGSSGHYGGEAGEAEDQLREYAANMGVRFSNSTLKGWLKKIVAGSQTVEDYKAHLQRMAESAFPGIADQIKAGLTVREIADPYIQQMSQTLELNANDIDLFDPTIRKAFQFKDPNTDKVGIKPLWEFERELKRDPRWLQTNNARQALMTAGRQVLQDFGFRF